MDRAARRETEARLDAPTSSDRLADGREEPGDARAVAPVPRELTRPRTLSSAELGVSCEPAQRACGRLDVPRRDERAVRTVAEQIVGGSDTIGEDERKAAGGGLVHDDRPGLALGQEGEDVRGHIQLDDSPPVAISGEYQTQIELGSQRLETLSFRAVADEDEHEAAIVGLCNRSHEHVEPFLGHETSDGENHEIV